jgi:acyl-CoA synthetase (AMP-forming)/AMP-acid ligase II/surfactin synthase thioesterase subunit
MWALEESAMITNQPRSQADFLANCSVDQLRLLSKSIKHKLGTAENAFKRQDPNANTFPLSFAQEGFWFLEQLMPRNPSFNWVMAFHLRVTAADDVLRDVFQELVKRHEILRTRYVVQNGFPVQVVDPPTSAHVHIVNLRSLPDSERRTAINSFLQEETQRGFDIEKDVLCRFHILHTGANESVFCASTHLSIIDAWCRKVFVNDIASIAGSRLLSLPSQPELPLQYGDYAAWERRTLHGATLERLLTYWKTQLRDLPDLDLPTDYPRPAIQHLQGGVESTLLPKALTDGLKRFGKGEEATPFMAFLAVFQILLMLYSGQNDFAVGVPIVNRTRAEFEGLFGRFVNTLILRTRINVQQTFRTILGHVREVVLAGMTHQSLPFELLIRELRIRREPDRNPLARIMFQLEDIPASGLSTGGLIDSSMVTPIEVKGGASVWDLNLHIFSDWDKSVLKRPEEFRAVLYYDSALFARRTILRMLDHYKMLIQRVLSTPDEAISELVLVSTEERAAFERRTQYRPRELEHRSYPEAFAACVARYPQFIAITEGDRQLTYEELNHSSNQLAHYLRSAGLTALDKVVVSLESSAEQFVAVLAVLKIGASFLLVCPEEHRHQWQAILEDVTPAAILTNERIESKFGRLSTKLMVLEREWSRIAAESGDDLTSQVVAGSAAYVHFHFGLSISVEHRDLLVRLQWLQNEAQLGPGDTILQRSSPNLDIAICEMLWPLAYGARVVTPGKLARRDTDSMELIGQHQVTVLYTSATELADWTTVTRTDTPNCLRLVLCSGELPRPPMLQRFFLNFHCALWHLYAPPAASTEVAVARFREHEPESWLHPLSEPTGSVCMRVLNESLKPLPVGVTGQIYIARWRSEQDDGPAHQSLLATGDLARVREDGNVELVGNTGECGWIGSHQIIVSEVAGALLQEASVEDCVVRIRRDTRLSNQLVAYVVTSKPWAPENLHRHLQSLLPHHALPNVYVPVTRVPLTEAGDVDWPQLEHVEVIDSDLLSRWENNLQNISGICQVAVVASDAIEQAGARVERLHLSDLLPASAYKPPLGVTNATTAQRAPEIVRDSSSSDLTKQRFSISDGGPVATFSCLPANLSESLQSAAIKHPDHGVLYISSKGHEQFQHYPYIFEQACRILAGLRSVHLQPGEMVILQVEKNPDFVQAFWACVLGGFVPVLVPVPPTYAQANAITGKLAKALQMLDRSLVLTSQNLVSSLTEFAQDCGLHGLRIECVEKCRSFAPELHIHGAQGTDPALLLLTSGSTGMPKFVPLTHGNVLTRAGSVAARHSFSAEDVSLNWMPLDHVGGIVMFHLQDVVLGSKQIHVETELITQSVLKWLDLIDQHRVTITWAPNFAYALVNSQSHEIRRRHWDLSSLRFILNGGEAIVPRTAKKFMQLLEPFGLPKSAMHPAWGMSETSSAVTYSDVFLAETTDEAAPFIEVGTPNPGFQTRIVDDRGVVLEEGNIGRLQVMGTSVMSGYLNRDDLNSDLFQEGGWFETGDLGYLRNGSLTITGRRKDVVIVNGVNCHCQEIEVIVEQIEGVEPSYTAACAVRSPHADSDQLAVFFHPGGNRRTADLIAEIRARVAQSAGITPEYVIAVRKEDVSKTSIGKIQRSQMKERFEAGEFDAAIRKMDIQLGNHNTLPDWFYKKSWCARKATNLGGSLSTGTWLLLMDEQGLGSLLQHELTALGRSTIAIEMGHDFAKIGDAKYRVQPANREHYQRLFRELASTGHVPSEIVHLCTYAPVQQNPFDRATFENGLTSGAYNLLVLIQQIAASMSHPLALTVVSSHSQRPDGEGQLCCERAALRGLLKTADLEMPLLTCRHIDLPRKSVHHEARLLLQEFKPSQIDPEVFHADGLRMVPCLDRASLNLDGQKSIPFKMGGAYLLSGGLGGVGSVVAKHLLKNYEAHLLLLGRTLLPNGAGHEECAQVAGPILRKAQIYGELEQFGDVCYGSVDVCDASAVAGAVARAQARWGRPLDGVIHLAASPTDQLLQEESQDTLAAAIRTKLYGAWVLSELVRDNPEALFITTSSASSLWGAVGMSSYCSANESLECFVRYQRSRGVRSHCFSWTQWEGVGMSRDYRLQSAYHQRGMLPISVHQGINSLLAGLCHDQAELIVGLDGRNSHIRRRTRTGSCQRQQIYAHFTANRPIPADEIKAFVVADRFRNNTICQPVQTTELPLTEGSEIDRTKLTRSYTPALTEQRLFAPPTTEIECQIVDIWKRVLGLDQIGIHDDFFSLGGHSILAVYVMAEIRAQVSRDLPLRTFLESPTVAGLAAAIQRLVPSDELQALVPIQPMGGKRALFMVHPAGGNVLCYQPLGAELGSDQPLYGLEEVATKPRQGISLEEMAGRYCRAIQTFQPRGPYLLGGWSLGGIVAFEMARQLREKGEHTLLLAIIDVTAPDAGRRPELRTPQDSTQALLALCKMLEIYTGRSVNVAREELEIRGDEEQIEYVFDQMMNQGLLPPLIDLPYFERYLGIYQSNLATLEGYTPLPYDGKIVVIRSTEVLPDITGEFVYSEEQTMGWQKYTPLPIDVHFVPGNHLTMMTLPRIKALADVLRSYLS